LNSTQTPKIPKHWLINDGSYEPYEGYFGSTKNPLRISKIRDFYISKYVEGQNEEFIVGGELQIKGNKVAIEDENKFNFDNIAETMWTHEFQDNAYVRATDFGQYIVYDEAENTWYIFWIR
jgi:hypothetical protein